MINLKTLLQSKLCYFILIIITVLNVCVALKYQKSKSIYQGTETIISGYINSIYSDGNQIKIILKTKEKVKVNYYAKTKQELEAIIKNYQIGDWIKVSGTLTKPKDNSLFNLFNYRHYLLSQKVYWLFKGQEITKLDYQPNPLYLIKRKIVNRVNSINKSSPYLKTYLFSETNDINNDVLTSYQANGLSHLLSLSGTHISFFVAIILFLLNKIKKKSNLNFLLVTIILLFYLFLTNYPPSLLRAVFMFILLKINKIFDLKIKTINLMIIVCSTLLLYNPYYIFHLGFKFSFIISFYLIIFKELFQSKNYFINTCLISLIAFIVSIPILSNNFFEINLLIPITNLLFIFIFIFLIFPLSIIVLFIPILDQLLYSIILITENLSLFINKISFFKITLPYIPIILIFGYYFIITFVLISFKNNKYLNFIYIILVLIIHYYSPYFYKYPVITFIDVGQGDSTLIELPKNKGNILIDTGGIVTYDNSEWMKKKKDYSIVLSQTIPYLKSRGIRKIDYLILTHGDYDHLGEALTLINNYKINKVIFNSGNNNDLEQKIINELKTKNISYYFFNQTKININGSSFYFLNKKDEKDENEDSLIIYTRLNQVNILLTGDAGTISEKYLIDTYNLPKMDILKVGHHGSKNSSSKEFIKWINPSHAVISAGINNRYNHPHQEVIDILNENQVSYYLTSLHGSIKFTLKNKLLIKPCH